MREAVNKLLVIVLASVLLVTAGCTGRAAEEGSKTEAEKMDVDGKVAAESLSDRAAIEAGDEARIVQAMRKAYNHEKVTIGFIGGSITEGAAASSSESRFASLTVQWWKEKFPSAEIDFVNAGIGATDTLIGVHRVDKDLLQHNPDFVVVDYAVNDSFSPQLINQYEGLIRKILQSANNPGVMLLFMMHSDGSNLQWVHSEIGSYYHLPMISFKDAVWPQIQNGQIAWDQLFVDDVHPNDAGHSLVAKLITDRLEAIYDRIDSWELPGQADFELPEPKTAEGYANAKLLTANDVAPVSNSGWQQGSTMNFSPGWIATAAGQSLEFQIDAANIGIIYEKSNLGRAGRAEIQVDNLPPVRLEGHFPADWGGYTAGELVAGDLPLGLHKVKITFLAEHDPDSTGEEFKICGIMAAH